jgi:hypothetical protein
VFSWLAPKLVDFAGTEQAKLAAVSKAGESTAVAGEQVLPSTLVEI